ncbi:MAG: phage terminase large subunit [Deltaproteobacteria bacterium]|nr:phage terminase large subunit [Deltaproteobacteria bacterium]
MAELTLKKKYSKKEFQKRADEILGSLFREATAFADTSEAAKQARREQCRQDHFAFFKLYLPHYFSSPEAPFHHELVGLLEKRPVKAAGDVVIPVVVAAPREFAKTTITSFAYVIHQICFNLRHFVILGSDTEDLASDLTGYIYLELLYNERLKCDFGELVRDNWPVDDFVTLNDVRLKARGRGQRVRGLKHKQWRPDLIILDDLENDQNVRNPEMCRKLLKWVLQVVYPCIDPDVGGNLFWIGTILANKSALYTAIHSKDEPWPEWTRRLYKALYDEDGVLTSLWPTKHPVEKLLKQKKLMGSLAFNTEKQNDPINEEGVFQEAWIKYYHPEELRGRHLVVAGFFDPSVEASATSDFKAIITVGWDRREMVYYVLDAYIKKASIDAAIGAAYARHEQWGYWQFGVEIVAFQKLLLREFDRAAQVRGFHLPIKGMDQTVNKETRISGMSPKVERGQIRFCRGQGDQDLLLEQLCYFPAKTVHDDGPDALQGCLQLLEGGAGLGLFDFYRDEVEKMQAEERRRSGQKVING